MSSTQLSDLPFSDELAQYAAATDHDLIEGAYLVAKIVDATVDIGAARLEFERLAARVGAHTPASIVGFLNSEGFHGDHAQFFRYENSDLTAVLRTKQGIPITLALVVMEVGRRCDLTVAGLNVPGYFLARLDEEVVDPFNMQVLDTGALQARNVELKHLDALAVGPVTNSTAVLSRMLHNLCSVAQEQQDYIRALEFTDYMTIVDPDNFNTALARAEVWAAMGDVNAAKEAFEIALESAPTTATKKLLEEQLRRHPWDKPNLN